MAKLVVMNAILRCTQGVAPASLSVILPRPTVGQPPLSVATVDDYVPMANIAPFGMCNSPANPQVAAATAAAMGVLTPQPCIPATSSPWKPGAQIASVEGVKMLTDSSMCLCQWAGQISIQSAGSDVDVT
jgi:hypothetical protein